VGFVVWSASLLRKRMSGPPGLSLGHGFEALFETLFLVEVLEVLAASFFKAEVSSVVLGFGDTLFIDFDPPSHGFRCIVIKRIETYMSSVVPSREVLTVIFVVRVIVFVAVFVVLWDIFGVCGTLNVEHAVLIRLLEKLKV
jgi:hypothetical protein